jgi:hypothetical protein
MVIDLPSMRRPRETDHDGILTLFVRGPSVPISGAGFGTLSQSAGQVAGRSSGQIPRATLDVQPSGLATSFMNIIFYEDSRQLPR